MGNIGVQGEQSTASEIATLTKLNQLTVSGAGFAIARTPTGFTNVPIPTSALDGLGTAGTLAYWSATSTLASVTLGAGLALSNGTLTVTSGSGTVTSVSVTTANGISGSVATATTTPAITLTLGAITPTTVNGNTFTTGTYTLTGQAGKTLTFNGSITLTGTDAQTYTFPTTSATIARTDAANTFTGASTTTSWTNTTQVVASGLTASGAGANDFSGSSGTFLTSTGANSLSGAVTITAATTPSLTTASGKTNTGFLQVNGKTSGGLKITTVDAAAQTVTLSLAAQTTGAATLTIPDMANTNKTVAWLESPTFTTPNIGAATATTVNSLTITSSTGTLTITNLKTVSFSNTITFAGTDSTTMTFPAASTTVAGLGTTQTFTGINTFTPAARSSGVASYFVINVPADTAQTAATESIGFKTVTATRTWATTGTVALQRENYFAGVTYASASASQTFTDITTVYIDKPLVGSNAIFTRAHSLTIVDSTSAASSITGGFVISTTLGTTATSVGIGGGNINAGGTLIVGGHVTLEGVTSTGATGTGKLVFDGTPTLVSPLLGTPTSGVLTNCTGLPAAAVVAGTFGTGSYTMDANLTVKQVINTSNAITASANAATVPITSRVSTVTNNSAATLTITITTTSAVDGQLVMVRVLDFSAVAQTIAWVNTENSTVTAPTTSNGSTSLPLTIGFQYNSGTSKWRCIASA